VADRRQLWVAVIAIAAAAALALHFVHLRQAEDALRICSEQLEATQAAKEQFALDHGGQEPDGWEDLVPAYLDEQPDCPAGGLYTLGDLTELPTCSIDGHQHPEGDSP
jgi:hypothetical protein